MFSEISKIQHKVYAEEIPPERTGNTKDAEVLDSQQTILGRGEWLFVSHTNRK
jgi:hypothetical protein